VSRVSSRVCRVPTSRSVRVGSEPTLKDHDAPRARPECAAVAQVSAREIELVYSVVDKEQV